MPHFPKLADNRVLGATDTALALKLVSENDLLRLKTIARLYARGLPPGGMGRPLRLLASCRPTRAAEGTGPVRRYRRAVMAST